MTHPRQSEPRWIVRMAVGSPVTRAIKPFVVDSHDDLGKVLGGLLAAVSLTASDEHIQVTIDPAVVDG